MQNKIEMYTHCRKCLTDKPEGVSPADWSRLECGFTEDGFQVWCRRCEMSIVILQCAEDEVAEELKNITHIETSEAIN